MASNCLRVSRSSKRLISEPGLQSHPEVATLKLEQERTYPEYFVQDM